MIDLKPSITKDELASLPLASYEGPIHLVSTPLDVKRAEEVFGHERVVGIDTETPPTFRVGQSHLPSLVQVAASRAVYLFQLNRQTLPLLEGPLVRLLESDTIVKAGIGLDYDFKALQKRFLFKPQNVEDLAAVVRHQKILQTGVRNLAGIFLGIRIGKGQQTSNWGNKELTPNQIRYAATDAWVCQQLYLCFEKRGFVPR